MTHGGQRSLSNAESVPLLGESYAEGWHTPASFDASSLPVEWIKALEHDRTWKTRSFTISGFFFFLSFFLSLRQAEDVAAVSDLFESILEHFLPMTHMALS